jgi:hypothetical protein
MAWTGSTNANARPILGLWCGSNPPSERALETAMAFAGELSPVRVLVPLLLPWRDGEILGEGGSPGRPCRAFSFRASIHTEDGELQPRKAWRNRVVQSGYGAFGLLHHPTSPAAEVSWL